MSRADAVREPAVLGRAPCAGERASISRSQRSRGRSTLGRRRRPSRPGCARGRTALDVDLVHHPGRHRAGAHAHTGAPFIARPAVPRPPRALLEREAALLRAPRCRDRRPGRYISAPTEFVARHGDRPPRGRSRPCARRAPRHPCVRAWVGHARRCRAGARRPRHGPFLLYPAVTWPHKNHVTAVRALARAPAPAIPTCVLVLTGAPGRGGGGRRPRDRRLGLTDAVRRTGRIPAVDINGLYDGRR